MVLVAAFILGALLLAGSALADIKDKSGYEQLKDAIKLAAANCTENYQSFTAEFSTVLKEDGQVLYSDNHLVRYDTINSAKEETTTTKDTTTKDPHMGNRSLYRYADKNQSITKSSNENNYIVTTYQDEKTAPLINKEDNPFHEERIKDLELIFDALVGNLREQVVVKENPDGSKALSGKLSAGQIPALINAMASFITRQEFNGNRDGLVHLASDVYIQEVWGTAKISADGSLENIMGTINISGLDKEGREHEITLEMLFGLSDVNATAVVKPDLSGKEIVTREERDFDKAYKPTAEKFVGKFKNDILLEKDGRFIKIGERQLEITQLNDEGVQGNFREVLREGYENYAGDFQAYTFNAKFNSGDSNGAALKGMTEQGAEIKGNIHFNGIDARIYLDIDQNQRNNNVRYDSNFRPDFD